MPNNTDLALREDIQRTERSIKSKIREDRGRFEVNNRKSAIYIAVLVLVLVLGVAAGIEGGWIGAVAGFLLIGIVQYHLNVAIHEASHFTLFAPRAANEIAGHMFAALLGFDFSRFREHHIQHHIHYATDKDPDWPEYQLEEPMSSRMALVIYLLRERCFWGAAVRLIRRTVFERLPADSGDTSIKSKSSLQVRGARIIPLMISGFAQLGLLAVFWWLGNWWYYVAFWVLPLSSIPMLIAGMRMFGEHGKLTRPAQTDIPHVLFARTCAWRPKSGWSLSGIAEWWTFGAFNFDFHHEHHWFPSVPYHALPHIHSMLWDLGHFDRHPQCYAESFADMMSQYIANK